MSVRVQGLTKRFSARGSPALENLSFEAPSGAITSLIGPSGAGKSTVLRTIAGLEIPDSGRIHIEGEDITDKRVQERGVGFVFQSYALFQHMNVRDNIAFGLDMRRRPRAEVKERVDELLRLIQLEDLALRFPAQLSGGQRQRVAFARALAVRPKVLLLDEPFGALDARVRADLREWLQRFHEQTHVTTILVTHDQTEALELSHQVVLILEGRMIQAGAPLDVYDHPKTPAVASFLGASLLRGHIREGRAEVGSLVMHAPSEAQDGDTVRAYVRSHNLKVSKGSEAPSRSTLAQVLRLRPIGAYIKVTLELNGGETLTIELSRIEAERLAAREGDKVLVDVQNASVFWGDYSI